jgi:phosphatidylglycerophosphatase C
VARFAFDRDHGRVKGAVLAAVLGGATRPEIESLSQALIASLRNGGLRQGALEAIERHRRAGDYLVLLSASPDLYVPSIGSALGFDESACTEVRWNGTHLDGHLGSPNRRGAQKCVVVSALIAARRPLHSAAYGNASSDLAHLALVDEPQLVNGGRRARRGAGRAGIPTERWP